VNNLEESLKFYHEIIGLKISERFKVGEDIEIVMLGETHGPKVELIRDKKQTFSTRSEGLSIGFMVNSLDESMELLKNKNIPIKRGPISPVPSVRFLFIDDPNGIEIQIAQQN